MYHTSPSLKLSISLKASLPPQPAPRTSVTCARSSASAGSAGSSLPTAGVSAPRRPRPGGTRGRSACRCFEAQQALPEQLWGRTMLGRGCCRVHGAARATCRSERDSNGPSCHRHADLLGYKVRLEACFYPVGPAGTPGRGPPAQAHRGHTCGELP